MQNEYIFILEHPTINICENAEGVEKQAIVGGFMQGGNFSYQNLPPKKLWLNLIITTNPRSKTSLCFFESDDGAESNCCRLIHAVDNILFDSLERKLESSIVKKRSICITLGEIKSHNAIAALEMSSMVKDGLLIRRNESFGTKNDSIEGTEKCLSVALDFGSSLPTTIEVELVQANYQFCYQIPNEIPNN